LVPNICCNIAMTKAVVRELFTFPVKFFPTKNKEYSFPRSKPNFVTKEGRRQKTEGRRQKIVL